jgi:hypothetical protein
MAVVPALMTAGYQFTVGKSKQDAQIRLMGATRHTRTRAHAHTYTTDEKFLSKVNSTT